MPTIFLLIIMCILFVLGLVAGLLIRKLPPVVGAFTINHSDPTKDFCNLRLDVDIDKLEKLQTFALKLAVINDTETE